MHQMCKPTVEAVFLATVIAIGAACDVERSANPLSPHIAGPIAGVTITAPQPIEPTSGVKIRNDEQPVDLSFANASSNSARPLWHTIEIATDPDFVSMVHFADKIEPGEDGRVVYRLAVTLDPETTYYWRTQALDGANTSPFSSAAHFQIVGSVVIETPVPVAPIGGETTATAAPDFIVTNGNVSGPAGPVNYRFEIDTDPGFGSPVAVLTTARSAGSTTSTKPGNLPLDQQYFWRANGTDGIVTSPWSATQNFRTPAAPPPPDPGPPPPGGCCPPPNRFVVVQQVAAETGSLYDTDVDRFTQLVAERLAAEDPRWGRRRNDSGTISFDVVAYRVSGSSIPYSVDIVRGAKGPNPQLSWLETGQVGGTWISVQ